MAFTVMTPLFNVEDMARSLAFYRDLLGLEVVSSWSDAGMTDTPSTADWAHVKTGSFDLMLNWRSDVTSAERKARTGYTDMVLYVHTDGLHAKLADAGHAPGPIEAQPYGVNEFIVNDPDGYQLAFVQMIEGWTPPGA